MRTAANEWASSISGLPQAVEPIDSRTRFEAAEAELCFALKANRRRRLLALLAGVFVSRVIFALVVAKMGGIPESFYTADSYGYLKLAQSLLHGRFFDDGVANIVRTPGYPFLLVAVVWFQHFLPVAVLENIFLAVVCAYLIWRIVGDLVPHPRATEWAVLLYAIEPVGFLYSAKLTTETLFCAQLLLFIWLVIRFLRRPSSCTLIVAAIALGTATYTRPIALYLGVWLAPAFLLVRVPRRALTALAFLSVFLATLAPWWLRNVKVAGYPGFSSIADFSAYFYSAAAVEARLDNKSFAQQQEQMGFWDDERYFQQHPEQRTWSRGQIALFRGAEARRIIRENWPIYLPLHVRGLVIVMLDTTATVLLQAIGLYPAQGGLLARTVDQGFLRSLKWLAEHYTAVAVTFGILGIQLLAYYLLAVLGYRRLSRDVAYVVAAVVFYLVVVSGGPLASGRLRAPIMPLICSLAGIAIAYRRPSSQSPRPRFPSLAVRWSSSEGSPGEGAYQPEAMLLPFTTIGRLMDTDPQRSEALGR